MATDQRSMRPSGSGPDQESDVGGIPGTMKRGVADATDRKAARRDGLRDDDGGGTGSALAGSTHSGAAPKEGTDRTGAPATRNARRPDGAGGESSRAPDGPRAGRGRSADGDESGQDDSLPESLGKSISEPFRSS